MKRRPLYSRSRTSRSGPASPGQIVVHNYREAPVAPGGGVPEEPTLWQILKPRWGRFRDRHRAGLLVFSSVALTLALIGGALLLLPPAQNLTQADIDAAVGYTLDNRPRPPALSALAYANVIPSVVRVNGYDPATGTSRDGAPPPADAAATGTIPEEAFTAVGTGVVIDDAGTILTNLHVANAARHLRVTFWDGTEANAHIIGARPDTDLAVIQPDGIPDDLKPATLASSKALHPGDPIVAIGFPFGIGPSASAGVISGLGRVFEGEDERSLEDLIQFDAAANPGNSGGPLIDADGDVVGIVTAILNPSGSRTFAGIGFAVPIEAAADAAGESPF
jgi:S1-C subfamily serine protease